MTEHKKRHGSVDQSSLVCGAVKRHKTDFSESTKVTSPFLGQSGFRELLHLLPEEKKEKLGERIMALQQLVSPFGKTDTASVLLEVMEYIKFLHDQVKVLSAPYLHSSTGKSQESEPYSLRSRGLCLMPLSCTLGIARSNGADIWAPIKVSCPKL